MNYPDRRGRRPPGQIAQVSAESLNGEVAYMRDSLPRH